MGCDSSDGSVHVRARKVKQRHVSASPGERI
jgi:hypothetical protein